MSRDQALAPLDPGTNESYAYPYVTTSDLKVIVNQVYNDLSQTADDSTIQLGQLADDIAVNIKDYVDSKMLDSSLAAFRAGPTAPDEDLGNDGDFYLDFTTHRLFGPKDADGWGSGVSVLGELSAAAGQQAVYDSEGRVLVAGLVQDTDARLSNARPPTVHKSTHAVGGSDALSPSDIGADVAGAAVAAQSAAIAAAASDATTKANAAQTAAIAASAQRASNLSDLASASSARTNLGLGTAATKDTGTGSGNVILGNDTRLSDPRTPTAHKTSHATGGSDALGPSDIGAVPVSLYDANTILYAASDDTPVALTVGASTVVGRASSGGIVALTGSQVRTITGLATTDSPTFGGGTYGAASAGPTIGAELGDGVSATQALTGLTIGVRYQVAAISGTMTAATLDGAALTCILNASSFVATATSHTVAKTAGTATGASVKAITAAAAAAPTVGGATVRSRNSSYLIGGSAVGQWLTTGSSNSAVGHSALYSATTGSSNNAVGNSALYALTTGSYNNAVGNSALYALTTGSYNSAVGHSALYALTTGSYNNALGAVALQSLTTGSYNNAVGNSALYALTTGSYNNAVGHSALYALTTGSYNNALGAVALYSATTGSYNNALGHAALQSLTTGSHNNALGHAALYSATGSSNNAIGQNAGRVHTTGAYNLALGNGAAYTGSTAGLSGTVAIGDDSAGTGAIVTANDQFVLGTPLHEVHVPGRTRTLGGRIVSLISTGTNRTIGAADHVVSFTASATATLPSATTAGELHVIKSAGAGVTVTLATTSSQTIDGSAPGTIAPWGKITVVADGSNWLTI